jgi:hypothetical protein
LTILVAGCEPTVLPPSQHAPTTADKVALYKKAPQKYEALGVIKMPITEQMKWDETGRSTAGIDALRGIAATMGANGVLFVAAPGTFDLLATTGYKGDSYQIPVTTNPKTAVVQAIFVISEK